MRMWGKVKFLDDHEEELIHRTMLRILDEVGVMVEDDEMLKKLEEFGGRVDWAKKRVTFSPEFMEKFISESEKFDWESAKPRIRARAYVMFGYYLNPDTNEYEPWTLRTILRYLKVAHYLKYTGGAANYAIPVDDIPHQALVLLFHYLAFKFNARSAASLTLDMAPYILEMCEAAAEELNAPINDFFIGHFQMLSPLRIGSEEAKVFNFFAKHGIKVRIQHMVSAGGTAPATLAGALALFLAEDMFINIVNRAYFGEKTLSIGCAISPLDMRTGMYPFGRPEKEMCNVVMAQMARRYGAQFTGHCGHTDAKRPSVEAGFQKALTSLPTLLVSGRTAIRSGLLSGDQVHSPIQMIIDDEIVGVLHRFVRGFEINEETVAFDVIKEVGPGGQFLDTDHTLLHFRNEFWEPVLFARETFEGWRRGGEKVDEDLALDIYHDIVKRDPLPVRISEGLERKLLDIIRKATGVEIEPVEPE